MQQNKQSGFTLVELAIVLVIIGLIVGGVLAGQPMIRNAELRSVISDRDSILAAVGTFQTRFNALPGDMRDATKYFGAQNADHATCIALTTAPTDTSTCNGNGDKQIGGNNQYEVFRAWQHLSNAELVPGSFSGVTATAGMVLDMEPDWNILESDTIAGAGWWITYIPPMNSATKAAAGGSADHLYDGMWGNVVILASLSVEVPTVGNVASQPVLAPVEMKMLDEKSDDGRPATGMIRVWAPVDPSATPWGYLYGNDCATTDDVDTAEYNIHATDVDIECVPIFLGKF